MERSKALGTSAVVDVATFPTPIHEPPLAKNAKMLRDGGLRDRKMFDEFTDAGLTAG